MNMFVYVLIMAGVTYLIRALPFTLLRGEIKSVWLRSFFYYVPYAVLGAMTFPSIFFCTGSVVVSAIGCAAAICAAFLGGGLVTAAVVSVAAVLLAGLVM